MAETYLCTPIRMDTEDTFYIVGFKPNATKMTAHHMLVYGCEEPGDVSPTWNCGEMAVSEPGLENHPVCASGSQIIYAWAMDAKSLKLPEGVGFRVGANTNIKCARKNRHSGRPDVTGLSLVFVAAEAGSDLVLRLLLSNFSLSADQPADNGFTPVFTAAQFGQNKTLAVLAEHGADFNRNFYENIFNLQQVTTS